MLQDSGVGLVDIPKVLLNRSGLVIDVIFLVPNFTAILEKESTFCLFLVLSK